MRFPAPLACDFKPADLRALLHDVSSYAWNPYKANPTTRNPAGETEWRDGLEWAALKLRASHAETSVH